MNERTISVVIPAYNRAHLVGQAIESVLEQDLSPHEIIVIDDGSTDDTAPVASGYPVRVISQENRGIGGARNRGILESSGELLAFLDSDDRWMRNRLSAQVTRLEASPRADLVFTHYQEVHERDGVRRVVPEPIAGWTASTLLARRSVFDRVGLFDIDLRVGEFVDWCIRARERDVPMVILPDVLVTRLVHGQNVMLARAADFGDLARVLKASLDRRRGARSAGDDPSPTSRKC